MAPLVTKKNDIEALCSLLDGISTSVLINGSTTPDSLLLLSREADNAGLVHVAASALSLAKSAESPGSDSATGVLLLDGLNQLRVALEAEAKEDSESSPGSGSSLDAGGADESIFAEDPELIGDFLTEAREHLSSIESQMLELEKNPDTKETIHAVFRTFHTIKGLAGFLAFTTIAELAHDVETLLDQARKGTLKITPPVVDIVLESADYLRIDFDRIEAQLGGSAPSTAADNRALRTKVAFVLQTNGDVGNPENARCPMSDGRATPQAVPPEVPPSGIATEAAPSSNLSPNVAESARTSDSSSVRVETAKLDHLLEMVGEMVIAQSLIRNHPVFSQTLDEKLVTHIAQLTRSSADIQRATMSMRMVPIGQIFQRSARLIRDLSRKSGKEVIFETVGEDTEVDKTIAEELCDPLLHMVRNAMDHGIESAEERSQRGKPAEGRISFKAYHRAGQIVVEITDDGRGLNRDKILAKAMKNGLVSADAQLTDDEIYQLIFEPGFSTSETITDVSGRGVGMDVVRRNVQKLRGRIEIQSTLSRGTTFMLRLPLTLAIIDGLVMIVGTARYVVPVFAVREMLRPTPAMLSTVQMQGEMALVRGKLLPIIRLHKRFGITPRTSDLSKGLLVVVESISKPFCLFVDDLIGKQEIVIKSLGKTFGDVAGLAGCAVLGDGRIGLILDVDGVYRGSAR